MKTLIIYASKCGSAREIAQALAHSLGSADIADIKNGSPSLAAYDSVIIGGSIYMGQIQRDITKYIESHHSELLAKKLGLFVSCCTAENTPGYVDQFFPQDLLNHACAVAMPGGKIQMEKLNFLMRGIVKMMVKSEDAQKSMPVSSINVERVHEFARQFAEA